MKLHGFLALFLIAAIGAAVWIMYAPKNEPPERIKPGEVSVLVSDWEIPFANLQIKVGDLEKRIDQLAQELASLPPTPAAHDATHDGADARPVWISYEEALASGKPILVHVDADWCKPCRAFDAHFQREEVIRALDRFACVKVDADGVTPSGRLALDAWARGSVPYEVLVIDGNRAWEGEPPSDFSSYINHLEDLP